MDPLSDGIYVHSFELPLPDGVSDTHNLKSNSNRKRLLVKYDFRPAFPPYTKQSLAEQLLILPDKKEELPPLPGEEEKTILTKEENTDQAETRKRIIDADRNHGALSKSDNTENEFSEEIVAHGIDPTTRGDYATVGEHDAAGVVTDRQASLPETSNTHEQTVESENDNQGEPKQLFENNQPSAADDMEDEATKEKQSEHNQALVIEHDSQSSRVVLATVGDVSSSEISSSHLEVKLEDVQDGAQEKESKSEIGGSHLEVKLEDGQDSAQEKESTSEIDGSPLEGKLEDAQDGAQTNEPERQEGKEIISKVQESQSVNNFMFNDLNLDDDPSSLSPSTVTERKNATTEKSESNEEAKQQTIKVGDDAMMEEHRPFVDVNPSQSFHQVELELPEKVVASIVGSNGENGLISGVSDGSASDDAADFESSDPKERRKEDEISQIDPKSAQYDANKNEDEDKVKPVLQLESDVFLQGNERLLKKSQQEDSPNPSSQEGIKHLDKVDKVSPLLTSSKDANRKFVTGLNEFDKFFESVEVPDELDVGADGSSLQDVLVGQGLKIIWKRAKNFSTGVKNKLGNMMRGGKSLGILAGDDAKENEELKNMFDAFSDVRKYNGDGNDNDSILSVNDARKENENRKGKEQQQEFKDKQWRERKQQKKVGKRQEKKKKAEFPLTNSKKVHSLLKFARRKLEQAMEKLVDLFGAFDDTEDDEDDAELQRFEIPNFDGKFGSKVDESVLKKIKEEMMEQNRRQQKK